MAVCISLSASKGALPDSRARRRPFSLLSVLAPFPRQGLWADFPRKGLWAAGDAAVDPAAYKRRLKADGKG